jgi:CRISPR-associated protein Cmr6
MIKSTRDRVVTDQQYTALALKAQHPGLWFDRYLQSQPEKRLKEKTDKYKELINNTIKISKTTAHKQFYKARYNRWLATLHEMGAQPRFADVIYRLAAGHGREHPIETGIFLHHSYGVPYIPGSSLKGVAAAYAANYLDKPWQPGSDAYETLFGATKSAGYVNFLDALPEPEKWEFLPDVITVHHPDYYGGEREPMAAGAAKPDIVPPADWDSPTLISFLAARGRFLIALLPSPGAELWADMAYRILKDALREIGVGGKTSSGYGRMTLEEPRGK